PPPRRRRRAAAGRWPGWWRSCWRRGGAAARRVARERCEQRRDVEAWRGPPRECYQLSAVGRSELPGACGGRRELLAIGGVGEALGRDLGGPRRRRAVEMGGEELGGAHRRHDAVAGERGEQVEAGDRGGPDERPVVGHLGVVAPVDERAAHALEIDAEGRRHASDAAHHHFGEPGRESRRRREVRRRLDRLDVERPEQQQLAALLAALGTEVNGGRQLAEEEPQRRIGGELAALVGAPLQGDRVVPDEQRQLSRYYAEDIVEGDLRVELA